ncbi:hypothetical protein VNI00_012800 [Paramarasmius palmivorus]|uniref:F-box domain-containing protein n=1 Tax=Paramarasmius palmivorus TaxID=297713 RepID=A0AAW0C4Q5_9AGAR
MEGNGAESAPKKLTLCSCSQHALPSYQNIPPPLPESISSNYLPTQKEAHETHELIEREEQILGQYREEMSRVRRLLEVLQAETKVLEERLSIRRAAVSTIRKIPVEVLDEIFGIVCHPENTPHGWQKQSLYIARQTITHPTALAISHTSSHWRRIMIARPHLWASIFVNIRGLQKDIRPLLSVYLQNSSGAPLDLRIVETTPKRRITIGNSTITPFNATRDLGKHGIEAFQLLFGHLSRCGRLEMNVRWEVLMPDVVGTPDPTIAFPDLHTFTTSEEEWRAPWFCEALQEAPGLRSLDMHILVLPNGAHILPYQRLTTLSLGYIEGVNLVLQILASCERLETLDLQEVVPEPDEVVMAHSLPLPALRKLKLNLSDSDLSALSGLFASLEMPLLQELSFSSMDASDPATISLSLSSFMKMLGHSPALRQLTLDIDNTRLPRDSMVELLQLLPELEQFYLTIFGDMDQDGAIVRLISGLTYTPRLSPPIGSKLTQLKLQEVFSSADVGIVEVFLNMVESRSRSRLEAVDSSSVTSLCEATLSLTFDDDSPERFFDPYADPVVEERLEMLQQDGVMCDVACGF